MKGVLWVAKKKKNIIEDIFFMMRDVNPEGLWPALEALTDIHMTDRDGRTVLVNAAFCGRLDVVRFALVRGADINSTDSNGFTALHFAVQEENLEMIRFLLEQGADVNARNIFGNNPIFIPKRNSPTDLFDLLIEHGADPHLKNNYDMSAADIWQSTGYPDYVLNFLK